MTQTLLPLDDFRRVVGFNPWHFWGLSNGKVPVTSSCNDLVRQYTWQAADAVGRQEISEAIAIAEARLAEVLGWWTAPKYELIVVPWPQYFDQAAIRLAAVQPPWHRLRVRLPKGKIRKIGYRRFALIMATVALTYSDKDGDGLNETWTATFATTVTDPDQIAIYFKATDCFDSPDTTDPDAMDPYRIRPVVVKISGGTATVTGKSWLMGLPVKHEGVSDQGLDPDTAANLATHIDAYRLYIDPTGLVPSESQGELLWDTEPYPHLGGCCCPGCSGWIYGGWVLGFWVTPPNSQYDPGAEAYALARVGISDSENGLVVPAEAMYNTTTGIWTEQGFSGCREPDRARIRVLSGYPLQLGQVADRMRVLVARMAMAELSGRICGCDQANHELHTWQFDMSRAAGANDEQFAISQKDLANPFGTRRGHIFAWREVESLAMIRGFAA